MLRDKTRVLFLITCSNRKTRQGESLGYDPAGGVREFLSASASQLLLRGRNSVCKLIRSREVSRDGRLLADLPFNGSLVVGPDLCIGSRENEGAYLPSAHRYRGRFYDKLDPEGPKLLTQTQHHVLIVSGLYGILTPDELIQCYSCHVPDHSRITKSWIANDRLSSVLTEYIQRVGILKIFDLMAIDAYRNLISWEMLRHATQGNVLHCFSKEFAGDALLPSLGLLAKRFLTESEEALRVIEPGDSAEVPDDEVFFEPCPIPLAPDLAREVDRQRERLTIADRIGRMRRNYIRIMDYVEGVPAGHRRFAHRVNQLRRSPHFNSKIADPMLYFSRVRNGLEYEGLVPTENMWKSIRAEYDEIENWARHAYARSIALEKVDA